MDEEQLKAFTAEYWKLKPSGVHEGLSFDNVQIANFSSIKFYRFIAEVEKRFKVKVHNLSQIATLKDLLANLK